MFWHCWLGGRKGIRPVKKTQRWGADVVICLERDADLHTAQLMPLPLTVSCFSKIQIGFTFLIAAYPGSPWQRAVKRVCMCVCVKYNKCIFLSVLLYVVYMSFLTEILFDWICNSWWLWSVLVVSCSAVTLMVEWQVGWQTCKNLLMNPLRFFWGIGSTPSNSRKGGWANKNWMCMMV